MLSLRKNILIVVIALFVQSCGFTPVYKEHEGDKNISVDLSKIDVNKIDYGRAGQELTTELENLFNPTNKAVETDYKLYVILDKKREALAVEKDGEITRYNLVVTANYRLKDSATGDDISSGISRIIGSFNTVKSDFATFAAEEDTLSRTMIEIANDIRFRLTSFFIDKK